MVEVAEVVGDAVQDQHVLVEQLGTLHEELQIHPETAVDLISDRFKRSDRRHRERVMKTKKIVLVLY